MTLSPQFTVPTTILPKKLHSIELVTSEKQPFLKELHRMRLAEEILSGESTSMVPSEDIQLSIHAGDIQGEKSTPSFLPEPELRKFVVKVGHHLRIFKDLMRVITRRFIWFELGKELMEGSITITWLIPAHFVKDLQEAIETTSSEFFMEHKIEVITIDGKECYSSLTREPLEYPKEQYTSQSTELQQSEKPLVGIATEKLHTFKSGTSEEQVFPKEKHRMRLAEEILSGESTSMISSEKTQSDTQRDTSPPSFLPESGLREFVVEVGHHWEIYILKDLMKVITHKIFPSEIVSQGTELMEGSITVTWLIPAHFVKDLQKAIQTTSSEFFMEHKIATIAIDGQVCYPSAEQYIREKCLDKFPRLLPSPEQYLRKTESEADPSLPTKYKDYLSSTPAIRAALCTTFNAKMAAEVFTWSHHTESPPPTTMTELFTTFTLKTLIDHLSTHPVYHKEQLKVTTFSDLPTDVYKQFQDLSRMAYEGILNRQQLVFSAAHLPTGFAPLSLMQEVPQMYTEGRATSYHFIHLTLQEFLAAIHVSQLPLPDQTRLVREHLDSGHFKMTIRFLAGLTKLASIPPDITKKLMEKSDTKLICFHFLFEAKDISMTTRTLGLDEMVVDSQYSWTPLDYYVTGHAVSHSNCPWRLDFCQSTRSINDDKFDLFCQGCAAPGKTECKGYISHPGFTITSKSTQSFVNIPPCILQDTRKLKLGENTLDESACDLLAKAVSSMTRLEDLSLNDNPLIGSGGAVEVIKALGGSQVVQLNLGSTGIGVPDCEALCELLKSSHSLSTTLRFLDLSKNTIGEGATALSEMLVESKSLTELVLKDCHISGQGASELAAALCKNSTLKILNLNHNPIGLEGASSMADMLQHNTSLEELNLHDDSVWHKGVWKLNDSLEHNQTLKKLQLPEKYKTLTSDHRIYWEWW